MYKHLVAMLLSATLACIAGCADPITPDYRYEEGYLVVDSRITDRPGTSYAYIRRNKLLYDRYALVTVPSARVTSRDDLGQVTEWILSDTGGRYAPPPDFAAVPEREYSLVVETLEGEVIESPPQSLPSLVGFQNLRWRFDQEAYFSDSWERFVPALTFLVDVDDPAGTDNYYVYRLRLWEEINICRTCNYAKYRGGECTPGPDTRNVPYYDYLCADRCWSERAVEGRSIHRDEFSDGKLSEGVRTGRIDFERRGGLLVEVEQANVSGTTYAFSENFLQLTENGGGLNAPLPAPLVGNLTDNSDRGTYVLGNVSLERLTTERIFLDRNTIEGSTLPPARKVVLEPLFPDPPRAPCDGPDRSTVPPEGWSQ